MYNSRLSIEIERKKEDFQRPTGCPTLEKPRLYLSNAASLKTPGHKGPGRVWAAMARPPWWLGSEVRQLMDAAPLELNLHLFKKGEMTEAGYFECFRHLMAVRLEQGALVPGQLRARGGGPLVSEGDTLICTCPRPGSPRRRHRCHLEELAPYLERAGWQVVLYGEVSRGA